MTDDALREKAIEWLRFQGLPVAFGHADDLAALLAATVAEAVAEEREACAKIAASHDPYPDWTDDKMIGYCGDETLGAELELSRLIAREIRARATPAVPAAVPAPSAVLSRESKTETP